MASISMTGFGRGEAESDGVRIEVELASVNRKQFDFSFYAPQELAVFEAFCRERVHARVTRGRVNAKFSLMRTQDLASGWNVDAVRDRITQLRELAKILGVRDDVTLRDILALPDFEGLSVRRSDEAVCRSVLEAALMAALDRLCEMRMTEGAVLATDLQARVERLRVHYEQISVYAPEVPKRYQMLLHKRIAELGVAMSVDEPALAREVAFFAERCDVTEELTRLNAHFNHFNALLKADTAHGRQLDFLCQEMNREVNTIGSKAADSAITVTVIEMKSLIETIREQVQNLE